MMRRITWFPCAAMLAVAGLVFVLPQRGHAQGTAQLLNLLEQPIESKLLEGRMADVLSNIVQKTKAKFGRDLPIVFETNAFRAEFPDAPDIHDTRVSVSPFPEQMKIGAALRRALDCVETKNATYIVMPDHILITTYSRASAEGRLHEGVRGVFKGQLEAVLQALSEAAGASIVLDPRVGDKAKTAVSATFLNDIPLAGALRTFTEMAGLKVLVLDGVIFVTTEDHADVLRKEHKARTPPTPAIGGFGTPGPVGGAPGLPGFPTAPGSQFEYPVDPLWPYVYNPYGPWRGLTTAK